YERIDRLDDEIHALLVRQSADDAIEEIVAWGEAEALLDRAPVADATSQALDVVGRNDVGVGRWIPNSRVDAVDDSLQRAPANTQEAIETHAALRRAYLARIGWTDRRDGVRALEAALEIADAAVILDAVDRIGLGREFQFVEDRRLKPALKCQIVNGDDRLGRAGLAVFEVGGRECRLPIMDVQDIGQ